MTQCLAMLCQRALDERGYLVINIDFPLEIGSVLRGHREDDDGIFECTLKIISETTREDGYAQDDMLGWGHGPGRYYYRTIAE